MSWDKNRQFFREFSIFRNPNLSIYYRSVGAASQPRLTVVVGKRISNSAVARNAVKRELYLLAQRAGLLSLKKDIVMVTMKSINLEEYHHIIKLFIETNKL